MPLLFHSGQLIIFLYVVQFLTSFFGGALPRRLTLLPRASSMKSFSYWAGVFASLGMLK